MAETEIPEDVINAMCLTWRHDFGLVVSDDALLGSGMTEREREGLRRDMRQIYQHHILPAILAERRRCADLCRAMLVFADTTSGADEAIPDAIMDPDHWLARNPSLASSIRSGAQHE